MRTNGLTDSGPETGLASGEEEETKGLHLQSTTAVLLKEWYILLQCWYVLLKVLHLEQY